MTLKAPRRSFAGQPGLGSLRAGRPAASAPRQGQATAALQQTAVESQVAKPTDISKDRGELLALTALPFLAVLSNMLMSFSRISW